MATMLKRLVEAKQYSHKSKRPGLPIYLIGVFTDKQEMSTALE
ncbi:hypothetical protein [Fastidiosibacter lacustris]|nr:hypothetical protein [Fastidiosibacter lacustris]